MPQAIFFALILMSNDDFTLHSLEYNHIMVL
jgi:hypothetical protein